MQRRELRPGARVGPYVLEQAVGSGGAASVWVAAQAGRRSVLKILHPHLANFPEPRARFAREVTALTQLEHPNIVRAHGLLEADGLVALELEHIEGLPLHAVLLRRNRRRTPFTFAELLTLFRALLTALQAAHDAGVVHRDIKPQNIMLEGARLSEVRLIDFGIAKLEKGEVMTTQGRRMGTPAYMAPEQALGWTVDRRSDLFSLTTLLFECLTFHRPWVFGPDGGPLPLGRVARTQHRNRWPEVLERIVRGERPRPSRYCPDVEPPIDAFFETAWQSTPDQRPSSATHYLEALEHVFEEGAALGAQTTLVHLDISDAEFQYMLQPPSQAGGAVSDNLHEGSAFGRFELRRRLEGLETESWLAVERSSLQPVLLEIYEGSEALEAWFFDKAEASCRDLLHPSLLHGIDFGRHRDHLFFARAWPPAVPLRSLAGPEGSLPPEALRQVAIDVAAGLSHAHEASEAGLVHGALRPSSIVVKTDGVAAIADFVRAAGVETAPGEEFGYLAPERLLGEPPEPRGDVYALAVVLHELASGRRLFPVSRSRLETLDEILRRPPPPLASVAPTLPSDFCAAVDRALAKQPQERFAHAAEFLAALGPAPAAEVRADLAARAQGRLALATSTASVADQDSPAAVPVSSSMSPRTQPSTPIFTPPPAPSPRTRASRWSFIGLGALALGGWVTLAVVLGLRAEEPAKGPTSSELAPSPAAAPVRVEPRASPGATPPSRSVDNMPAPESNQASNLDAAPRRARVRPSGRRPPPSAPPPPAGKTKEEVFSVIQSLRDEDPERAAILFGELGAMRSDDEAGLRRLFETAQAALRGQ